MDTVGNSRPFRVPHPLGSHLKKGCGTVPPGFRGCRGLAEPPANLTVMTTSPRSLQPALAMPPVAVLMGALLQDDDVGASAKDPR